MHFGRRSMGLASKQLTSEIWKLFVTVEIPPINLGWKVVQEEVVSSHAPVHETRKVDNDHSMNELKIAPDKLPIKDKYMVDCPIEEQITFT
jgi:hypothetical protein